MEFLHMSLVTNALATSAITRQKGSEAKGLIDPSSSMARLLFVRVSVFLAELGVEINLRSL